MILNCAANEGFEISPRFRQSIESRVAKLERDAESDEAVHCHLNDIDHIRRQMRLVAMQRSEALSHEALSRSRPHAPAAAADRALNRLVLTLDVAAVPLAARA